MLDVLIIVVGLEGVLPDELSVKDVEALPAAGLGVRVAGQAVASWLVRPVHGLLCEFARVLAVVEVQGPLRDGLLGLDAFFVI